MNWNVASGLFKQDVSLQTLSLIVIYQIEAIKIKESPPRNWIFQKRKKKQISHDHHLL